MKIRVNQFYDNVDCPREFVCAHCGAHVYVTDIKDKRVKYCSAACEKQYWREKSKQDATYKKRSREKTIGMRNYSKKEMARSESMIKIANVIISNGDLALRAAKFKDDMLNADNKLPKMLEG